MSFALDHRENTKYMITILIVFVVIYYLDKHRWFLKEPQYNLNMITPLNIYLIMQADKISSALFTISTIAIVAVILAFVWHDVNRDCYGNQDTKNPITKSMITGIIATFLLATAIPSTKTLCMMYALPAIVNSKVVQNDFPELYDIALQATKEKLQEMVKPVEGKKWEN